MITCDTHVLLHWALTPDRLSAAANQVFEEKRAAGKIACADIVLWEITMLIAKGRIVIPQSTALFLDDLLLATRLTVLPILPEIAILSQSSIFLHGDPADRLLAATALHHKLPLISADRNFQQVVGLKVIW